MDIDRLQSVQEYFAISPLHAIRNDAPVTRVKPGGAFTGLGKVDAGEQRGLAAYDRLGRSRLSTDADPVASPPPQTDSVPSAEEPPVESDAVTTEPPSDPPASTVEPDSTLETSREVPSSAERSVSEPSSDKPDAAALARSNPQAHQALSDSEQAMIRELQQRDREVRSHEAAHMAAGGQYVQGGAHYSYQRGPDGQMYAVGGEVSIRAASGSSPQETIAIARTVRRAALAPSQPSSQDIKVAAQASQMENRARAHMMEERLAAEQQKSEQVSEADSQDTAVSEEMATVSVLNETLKDAPEQPEKKQSSPVIPPSFDMLA